MNGTAHAGEVVPGEYAIAHHLIQAWVDGFAFERRSRSGESVQSKERANRAMDEGVGKGSGGDGWGHMMSAFAGAVVGAVVVAAALASRDKGGSRL